MPWKVWLKDGTTRESETCAWADVMAHVRTTGAGVLYIERRTAEGQVDWRNWGDGVYGDPETWVPAGYLSDEEWARFEAEVVAPV